MTAILPSHVPGASEITIAHAGRGAAGFGAAIGFHHLSRSLHWILQ